MLQGANDHRALFIGVRRMLVRSTASLLCALVAATALTTAPVHAAEGGVTVEVVNLTGERLAVRMDKNPDSMCPEFSSTNAVNVPVNAEYTAECRPISALAADLGFFATYPGGGCSFDIRYAGIAPVVLGVPATHAEGHATCRVQTSGGSSPHVTMTVRPHVRTR